MPDKIVLLLRYGGGTSATGNGNAYPPPGNAPKPPDVPDYQQDYVALPSIIESYPGAYDYLNQGNGSFVAHELGHYLGLYHTFPGWGDPYSGVYVSLSGVTSVSAADQAMIKYIANNGGTVNALDGDRISDTPPDPSVLLYQVHKQNICTQQSITVTGSLNGNSVSYTFNPDPRNVMSYYTSCTNPPTPQHFSTQQIQRMTQTLISSTRRSLLGGNSFYTSGKSTVTFTNSQGSHIIYSFVAGKNGHLESNCWDGSSWHWEDHGLPTGVSAIYQPNAVIYEVGPAPEVWVFSTASNGHLVANYSLQSAACGVGTPPVGWNWADQGLPSGITGIQFPNVVTYGTGAQGLYVFGTASNGHLIVNYWSGGAWHWADQGLPPATTAFYNASSVTPDGQQLYVFGTIDNGHLMANYWNGSAWQWVDHGLAPHKSGSGGVYSPNALVYSAGASPSVYVFCAGYDGQLVVKYGLGSSWSWTSQGLPSGVSTINWPSAVTLGTTGLYVFATANTGHLVVNYWDGSAWHWADQGLPSGATAFNYATAIVLGSGNLYVFGTNNNYLYVNYWFSGSWYWAGQGAF
jgi:hypothetical protein